METDSVGQRKKVLEFMINLRKEYVSIQNLKGQVWCQAGPIAEELARAERDINAYQEEFEKLNSSEK